MISNHILTTRLIPDINGGVLGRESTASVTAGRLPLASVESFLVKSGGGTPGAAGGSRNNTKRASSVPGVSPLVMALRSRAADIRNGHMAR